MVCDYHLGQLASNEKARRQGTLSQGETSTEERAIVKEIERHCP